MFNKFEVFKTINHGYAWRLRAANGQILCHSEVYTTKAAAQHGVNVVMQVASLAFVNDLT